MTQAVANRSGGAPRPQASFLQLTTRNYQMLSDASFTAAGQYTEQQVYATGYLAGLKILVFGTIVTGGSGSAGTFDANFWPWNLLARLTLKSNANFEFYNTSGFANRIIQKTYRLGFDPALNANPLTAAPYSTTGAKAYFAQAPSGASSGSTTYHVAVQYHIPVALHWDLRAGLLPLQNNATRVVLGLQLGQVTDWLGSSGTLGSGGSVSLTVKTEMDFFSIPADPNAQPDTSFIHRIAQEDVNWTASGDQIYRYPVNGVVMRLWKLYNNAGTPAKHFATANQVDTNNFNNMTVQYAATQNPEVRDFRHMLYDHRVNYATDVQDGLFMYDFSNQGSIEMGTNATNAINTRRLTELKFIENTTITPNSGALIHCIRQELQPRAA